MISPRLNDGYMYIDHLPEITFSLTDIVATAYTFHKIDDAHCLAVCKVLGLLDFTV